jgi:hypothetical protein
VGDNIKKESAMSLARFIARDRYAPAATEEELENLIPRMHGVVDWTIHSNGDVTLAYDRSRISDEVIEEALKGLGFQLKHICDEPEANEAEVHRALGH